jgi:hypothetical protein
MTVLPPGTLFFEVNFINNLNTPKGIEFKTIKSKNIGARDLEKYWPEVK